jgi:maltooligosyltrehalose trehalohydrolase
MPKTETNLGATYLGDGKTSFLVWAPLAERVKVLITSPHERAIPMEQLEHGYHAAVAEGVNAGATYFFDLGMGKKRPDPASRLQPQGVHGPSQVVESGFEWSDKGWRGIPLSDYIIYEMHTGTFTPEGTFDAAIVHLAELSELGMTAIELMPVAQFPGGRNWGYDGVYPFAVQDSYGGPEALKRFVNACHAHGIAAILDVVYNHLGPEGNYLWDFAPYFTDRYKTPWGPAMNFDGRQSDEVRRFLVENALYWVTEFHFDALRLDAVHAIVDPSALPFLEEMSAAVHARAAELQRKIYVIPESDRNDSRLVKSRDAGGYGMDAQWSDDFHHSLHTLLTGETFGYYRDFGNLTHLAKAFREGYVYSGDYSEYRQRRHGNSAIELMPEQIVVFAQNHDQIGNRMHGDRLSTLVDFRSLKLAAATVLLSPFVPLIFMGEEYGETAPFPYFISHGDAGLVDATRKGRKEEFAAFHWEGDIPDPQDETTFLGAKLNRRLCEQEQNHALSTFYKELIRLRHNLPALARLSKKQMEVYEWKDQKVLAIRRWDGQRQASVVLNFNPNVMHPVMKLPAGVWRKELDSEDPRWGGAGSEVPSKMESQGEVPLILPPRSAVLLTHSEGNRN